MTVSTNGIVNHYATLGLAREAPPSVVRAAWKALAAEYHPDRNTAADASIQIRRINDAFTVLGKPATRAAYDRALEAAEERATAIAVRPPRPVAPPRSGRDALFSVLLVVAVGLVTLGIGFRDAMGNRALPIDNLGAAMLSDTKHRPSLTKGFHLYSMIEASLKRRETVRIKPESDAELPQGQPQDALLPRQYGLRLR